VKSEVFQEKLVLVTICSWQIPHKLA